MDTDCADYDDYAACLRDLSRVNVVTGTHRPLLAWLDALAGDRPFTLLDVACGHGDALRGIAERHPRTARLTGIDLNPWAIQTARAVTHPDAPIDYIVGDAFADAPAEPFDVIVSTQFTHHLTDDEVVAFIRWLDASARRGWFIADLQRHPFAYAGFPILARLARWHRFVRADGQVSVARSFTGREWRGLLRAAGATRATVEYSFPFRLSVSCVA